MGLRELRCARGLTQEQLAGAAELVLGHLGPAVKSEVEVSGDLSQRSDAELLAIVRAASGGGVP